MSERQYTPLTCAGCGMDCRPWDMYEVEVHDIVHGETALLCGSCLDKWQYGENLEDRE